MFHFVSAIALCRSHFLQFRWLIPCWSPWRLALTLWHLASRRVSLSANPWQIVFLSFSFFLSSFFPSHSCAFDLFHTLCYTQRCQNIINMKESWEDSHIWDLTLLWNEWFCASYSELILLRLNIWDFQSKTCFVFCFLPHLWNIKSTVSECDIYYIATLSLGFSYVWVKSNHYAAMLILQV